MPRMLVVEMPDGSTWGVPLDVIARNRAAYYAKEFGGSIERSLAEDTLPVFNCDSSAVKDWAANNMNWSEVAPFAAQLKAAPPPDYREGWLSGEKQIMEVA